MLPLADWHSKEAEAPLWPQMLITMLSPTKRGGASAGATQESLSLDRSSSCHQFPAMVGLILREVPASALPGCLENGTRTSRTRRRLCTKGQARPSRDISSIMLPRSRFCSMTASNNLLSKQSSPKLHPSKENNPRPSEFIRSYLSP